MNQALLNLGSGEDLCNLLREVFSEEVFGASGTGRGLPSPFEYSVM